MEPHGFPACPEMVWANTGQHLNVYAGYPPEDAYTETYRNLSKLPFLFFHLDKRIYSLIHPDKNKDTSFQSTPHDITIKKKKAMIKKVSIITINYNGLKDTVEMIESLAIHETYPHEIIVVDNASNRPSGT